MKRLLIWTTNETWINAQSLKWSLVPKFPICQSLDLHDYFNLTENTPSILNIEAKGRDGFSISFILEERVKQTSRALKSHYKSYSGPVYKIENLGNPWVINALIVLSQTIYNEMDTKNPCRNYPFDKFKSYGDCSYFCS